MSVLSDFLPAGGAGGALVYKRELFTTSGTWTRPAEIWQNQVFVTAVGGGSSGNSSSNELGGASGQFVIRELVDVSASPSVSVTVGAGGAASNGGGVNAAGNAGNPSSFGALLSVAGGPAPGSTADYLSWTAGCNPGKTNSSSEYVNPISGYFGCPMQYISLGNINVGGSGLHIGTSSPIAGDTSDGVGGAGYGAGGASSASSSNDSGAGTNGAVLVEWYEEA